MGKPNPGCAFTGAVACLAARLTVTNLPGQVANPGSMAPKSDPAHGRTSVSAATAYAATAAMVMVGKGCTVTRVPVEETAADITFTFIF